MLDHLLTDAGAARGRRRAPRGRARSTALGRRGKYLIAELDDGAALLVHLRMTGNLRWLRRAARRAAALPARVGARSTTAPTSRYTDARRFGTWRVAEDGAGGVARRQARPGAARRLGGRRHGARVRGPAGARQGRAARPARRRRRRQHLRRRGAVGGAGSIRRRRRAGSRARASRACTQPSSRRSSRRSRRRAPRSATSARPTAATAPRRSASAPTAAAASRASAAARSCGAPSSRSAERPIAPNASASSSQRVA